MNFTYELTTFILVIFLAALTRSTFGFGDALIAMPLLAMFFSMQTATPIVAFSGFFISMAILSRNWRTLNFRMIWQIILFSILGIPLGVIFLKGAHEVVVKSVLAAILIIFSVYKLTNPELLKLKSDKSSFLFGLISGVFGGAYNTNGPPIIIYGSLRGWKPEEFRIILQGIFLPTNIFIIAGHGIAGLWTNTVFDYFLISLPVITIALIIGSKLNKIIPTDKFNKYVYWLLIFIGCVLIMNTFL